jgi:hypothetical protein
MFYDEIETNTGCADKQMKDGKAYS